MCDLFDEFVFQHYSKVSGEFTNKEQAWEHANSKGWIERRSIFENKHTNSGFIDYKCREHFDSFISKIELNSTKLTYYRNCRYGDFNDLYNYSIHVTHAVDLEESPVSTSVSQVYCINVLDDDKKLYNFIKMVTKYRINCVIMRFTKLVDSPKFMSMYNEHKSKHAKSDVGTLSYVIKLPGELGCALSHMMCLMDAVENNYKDIILLEDDVIPLKGLNVYFTKISNYLSKEHPYTYLGASQHHKIDKSNRKPPFYLARKTAGGFALYIHRRAMSYLIQGCLRMENVLDTIPWRLYEEKGSLFYKQCIVLYPHLFIADVRESNIRHSRPMKVHGKKVNWNLEMYDIN